MAKNKNTDKPVLSFHKRVRRADEVWRQLQQVQLDKSKAILKSWAAEYFSPSVSSVQHTTNHTINLLDRAFSVLLPYMIMSNPQIIVESVLPQFKSFSITTQKALNQWIRRSKLRRHTLYPLVRNSLVSMGIVKTGVMKEWQLEILGNIHDVGKPYADVIDPADWVCDPSCKAIDDAEFVGNYFYLPTEFAKEFYGTKYDKYIVPTVELFDSEHPRKVVTPSEIDRSPKFLKPMTRFVEHYLPDEGVVITQIADGHYDKIIREVEYNGPDGGPYDVLAYKWFPEYPIPIPPAWGWLDMDSIFNTIVNKVKQQAQDQKSVLAYEGDAADDAERLANAGDRQTVKVDHIEMLKKMDFDGVNENTYGFLAWLQQQFSEGNGNLDVLGGQRSVADTLGQEQMLMGNAGRSLESMLQDVYDCTESFMNKLAFYLWNDPLVDIKVIREVKGVATWVEEFNSFSQEGDLEDYFIRIKPMSMQRPTADGMWQKIIQYISQWVLPTMPIAAQQGVELDIPGTSKKLADLSGISDLELLYKVALPQVSKLNPYNPQSEGSGMEDGRTGMMGAASRNANLIQQQSRAGGQPSPKQN